MSQGSNTEYSQADIVDYTQPAVSDLNDVDDFAEFEINDEMFLYQEDNTTNVVDDLFERGQNHPDWVNFGKSFKSFKPCMIRIYHFLAYVDKTIGRVEATKEQLFKLLNSYFEEQHVRLKDDGETAYYSPTVFRTWFSMFDKWLIHTGLVRDAGGLKFICPVLYSKFKVWEDGYLILSYLLSIIIHT